MTILSCKIIYTVAKEGSFVKAASVLNLTPSAVSHGVSALEKEVGFQVFNRGKTGVTLTSYGEKLFPYVMEVLRSEESLNQLVDKLNGMEQGCVRIGAFNSVCIHWLPMLLQKFKEKYPGIEVEVYEGTYDDVISWLGNGGVEMGFLSASCNSGFPMISLYEDPLVCMVPKGFATKERGKITLEEMQGQSFVIPQASNDADIQKFLTEKSLAVYSKCHVIDDQATAAMVASGQGISITPALTSRSFAETVDILEIEDASVRTIGLVMPNAEHPSPAAKHLKKLILQLFQEEKFAENNKLKNK